MNSIKLFNLSFSFDGSNYICFRNLLRVLQAQPGLLDNRGRHKPNTIQTDEEKLRTENAALKARNEYLETENFWGTIKEEMYRLTTYKTFEKLENDEKRYIEFYNTKRVSLKMGLSISA